MGDKTGIEWSDATWNPTTGCDKVSAGCDGCYALGMSARLKQNPAYEGLTEMTKDGLDWTGKLNLLSDRLSIPIRWTRPRRIFVNSMSDLFHPEVPDDFIAEVWRTMLTADHHTYQILTKRPQRMAQWTREWHDCDHGGSLSLSCSYCAPLKHVWLGTSIEEDKFSFRANHVRRSVAAVRFLSLEPLLGPLPSLDLTDIDWVIVGGESGPNARPMHPDWARDLRDRCAAAGVAFLFKQWGTWLPREDLRYADVVAHANPNAERGIPLRPGFTVVDRRRPGRWFGDRYLIAEKVGKHDAGRLLDGVTHDGYPS